MAIEIRRILLMLMLVVGLMACGDDGTTGMDSSTDSSAIDSSATDSTMGDSSPTDSSTSDSAADTSPPGDGGLVDIPTVTAECATTSCLANSTGGIAFVVFTPATCTAALIDPTQAAGRGTPFTCVGGACAADSDDAPGPWEDDADVAITQLPGGTYGVIVWFDHNDNIRMGGGPDTGDTLCCLNAPVDGATSRIGLFTGGCMDV